MLTIILATHMSKALLALGIRQRDGLYKLLPTKTQGVGNMHLGSTGYNGCAKQVPLQVIGHPLTPETSQHHPAATPLCAPLDLDPDPDTLPLVSAATASLHLLAQQEGVGQGGLQWPESLVMHHDHLQSMSTGPTSKMSSLISGGGDGPSFSVI